MSTNESAVDPLEGDEVIGEGDAPLVKAPQKRAKLGGPLGLLWRVATSYGTSCVVLLILMGLTWRGTVDQVEMGLVAAQAKYFDSMIWYEEVGSFSLPMPGALLLQVILAINLLCGGMVRLRMNAVDWFVISLNSVLLALFVLRLVPGNFWVHFTLVCVVGLACAVYTYRRKSTMGIMIIHLAMAGLLCAGLIKMQSANSGYLKLHEGTIGNTYRAFHENELVLAHAMEDGSFEEFIVHDDAFKDIGETGRALVALDEVPFKLFIDRVLLNCEPRRGKDGEVSLLELPPGEQGRNLSGLLVTAEIPGEGRESAELWCVEGAPWTVTAGDELWTVGFRRRVRDLPWSLRLDKFIKEEHPGVNTPRVFASDVTRIADDGIPQSFHITMNAPLREDGFTFSQNNWGPQTQREAEFDPRTYSTLEVSTNPSDQMPKYCCFVIAYGMLIHFLAKLARYMVRA